MTRVNTAEDFDRYVDRSGECHLWTGTQDGHGYGKFAIGGIEVLAHRFAVGFRSTGRYAAGEPVVRHRCNTPLCVRRDHLVIGTQRENQHDAVRAGTASNLRIPQATIDAIRAGRAAGATQTALAREHGLSQAHVWRILHGLTRTTRVENDGRRDRAPGGADRVSR